jgi:hypothetical protein
MPASPDEAKRGRPYTRNENKRAQRSHSLLTQVSSEGDTADCEFDTAPEDEELELFNPIVGVYLS